MDRLLDRIVKTITGDNGKETAGRAGKDSAEDGRPARLCFCCDTPFGDARRHHCRICGRAFCSACIYRSLPPAPRDVDRTWRRVCDYCHHIRHRDLAEAVGPPHAAEVYRHSHQKAGLSVRTSHDGSTHSSAAHHAHPPSVHDLRSSAHGHHRQRAPHRPAPSQFKSIAGDLTWEVPPEVEDNPLGAPIGSPDAPTAGSVLVSAASAASDDALQVPSPLPQPPHIAVPPHRTSNSGAAGAGLGMPAGARSPNRTSSDTSAGNPSQAPHSPIAHTSGQSVPASPAARGRPTDSVLDSCRAAFHSTAVDQLQQLARQLLRSEGAAAAHVWGPLLVDLACSAAASVSPTAAVGYGVMDPRCYVKVKRVPEVGVPSDSRVVQGVVCKRNVAHRRMRSAMDYPHVLLLGGSLEFQRTGQGGGAAGGAALSSFDTLLEQEHEHLRAVVSKIAAVKPDVLLVERSVARFAQEELLRCGISLVINAKAELLDRLARCMGVKVLPSLVALDTLTAASAGSCREFRIDTVHPGTPPSSNSVIPGAVAAAAAAAGGGGGSFTGPSSAGAPGAHGAGTGFRSTSSSARTLMYFNGMPKALGCTILLFGADMSQLTRVKRALRFLVFAAYSLRLESSFLAEQFFGAALSTLNDASKLSGADAFCSLAAAAVRASADMTASHSPSGLLLTVSPHVSIWDGSMEGEEWHQGSILEPWPGERRRHTGSSVVSEPVSVSASARAGDTSVTTVPGGALDAAATASQDPLDNQPRSADRFAGAAIEAASALQSHGGSPGEAVAVSAGAAHGRSLFELSAAAATATAAAAAAAAGGRPRCASAGGVMQSPAVAAAAANGPSLFPTSHALSVSVETHSRDSNAWSEGGSEPSAVGVGGSSDFSAAMASGFLDKHSSSFASSPTTATSSHPHAKHLPIPSPKLGLAAAVAANNAQAAAALVTVLGNAGSPASVPDLSTLAPPLATAAIREVYSDPLRRVDSADDDDDGGDGKGGGGGEDGSLGRGGGTTPDGMSRWDDGHGMTPMLTPPLTPPSGFDGSSVTPGDGVVEAGAHNLGGPGSTAASTAARLQALHGLQVCDMQRIYISMACRNPKRQLLCEPHAVKRIDFYSTSDLSLLHFILAAAPHPNKHCAQATCGEGVTSHVRTFLHGSARITLSIATLPMAAALPGEDKQQLWMWMRPKGTGPASHSSIRRLALSPEACCLSFGHFLQLCFTADSLGVNSRSLHQDTVRYFGIGRAIMCLYQDRISPFAMVLPELVMPYSLAAQLKWLKQEASEVMQEANEAFDVVEASLQEHPYFNQQLPGSFSSGGSQVGLVPVAGGGTPLMYNTGSNAGGTPLDPSSPPEMSNSPPIAIGTGGGGSGGAMFAQAPHHPASSASGPAGLGMLTQGSMFAAVRRDRTVFMEKVGDCLQQGTPSQTLAVDKSAPDGWEDQVTGGILELNRLRRSLSVTLLCWAALMQDPVAFITAYARASMSSRPSIASDGGLGAELASIFAQPAAVAASRIGFAAIDMTDALDGTDILPLPIMAGGSLISLGGVADLVARVNHHHGDVAELLEGSQATLELATGQPSRRTGTVAASLGTVASVGIPAAGSSPISPPSRGPGLVTTLRQSGDALNIHPRPPRPPSSQGLAVGSGLTEDSLRMLPGGPSATAGLRRVSHPSRTPSECSVDEEDAGGLDEFDVAEVDGADGGVSLEDEEDDLPSTWLSTFLSSSRANESILVDEDAEDFYPDQIGEDDDGSGLAASISATLSAQPSFRRSSSIGRGATLVAQHSENGSEDAILNLQKATATRQSSGGTAGAVPGVWTAKSAGGTPPNGESDAAGSGSALTTVGNSGGGGGGVSPVAQRLAEIQAVMAAEKAAHEERDAKVRAQMAALMAGRKPAAAAASHKIDCASPAAAATTPSSTPPDKSADSSARSSPPLGGSSFSPSVATQGSFSSWRADQRASGGGQDVPVGSLASVAPSFGCIHEEDVATHGAGEVVVSALAPVTFGGAVHEGGFMTLPARTGSPFSKVTGAVAHQLALTGAAATQVMMRAASSRGTAASLAASRRGSASGAVADADSDNGESYDICQMSLPVGGIAHALLAAHAEAAAAGGGGGGMSGHGHGVAARGFQKALRRSFSQLPWDRVAPAGESAGGTDVTSQSQHPEYSDQLTSPTNAQTLSQSLKEFPRRQIQNVKRRLEALSGVNPTGAYSHVCLPGRTLLPVGVANAVIPVFDSEPTSMIAYFLNSRAYQLQLNQMMKAVFQDVRKTNGHLPTPTASHHLHPHLPSPPAAAALAGAGSSGVSSDAGVAATSAPSVTGSTSTSFSVGGAADAAQHHQHQPYWGSDVASSGHGPPSSHSTAFPPLSPWSGSQQVPAGPHPFNHQGAAHSPDWLSLLLSKNTTHIKHTFEDDAEGMPWAKAKFQVVAYYALQFAELRRRVLTGGESAFTASLCRCRKWNSRGGKSNAYFAKTRDDRFIIKSLSKAEKASFLEFAPAYFEYMAHSSVKGSPTTLAKVLGVFTVAMKPGSTGLLLGGPGLSKEHAIDVLIMENCFYDRQVSRIYDLKGSTRNRFNADAAANPQDCQEVHLDDNLRRANLTAPIFVDPGALREMEVALWADTAFLESLNVMDYSLLVGVDKENCCLCVAIIDFIRQYSWDKQLETWVKSTAMLGGNGKEPTIVSPKQYMRRFRQAMLGYFTAVPNSADMALPLDPDAY